VPLLRRIANLFRRTKLEDEIEAELRAHIQLRADDNRAAGMTPEEALRDAQVRFGNLLVQKERTSAVELNQILENLWRDLSYAFRQLRRSPGFALTGVITLALAVAANVVVFSIINSAVLSPVASITAGRLFNIVQGPPGYDNQSYPDYVDYRDHNTAFRYLAAYRVGETALSIGGAAYKCWNYEVSGNYFDMLEIEPQLGRLFHSSDEHGPDSAPYIVLSDAFWRSHFAADRRVIGASVRLNQHPFTVIGVAPASFHGTELFLWPDFWMPMINERQVEGYDFLSKRFNHGIWTIGRLARGVTEQAATANLNAIAAQLAKQYPDADEGMKARLVEPGLMGDKLGNAARAFLSAVMVLALLVLAAACANLAGIFAARAADRFREVAIRLAIGSSRWHVLRQLLAEALIVSLLGGALGTLCATVLLQFLSKWQPFAEFPIHVTVIPDSRVYFVACLLSLASTLLPAIVLARQLWRTDLIQAMKNAAPVLAPGRFTFRDLLLGIQIALCALLLTASLVGFRGMQRSLHAPFGFDPQGVVMAQTDMHMANYSDESSLAVQKRMLTEAAVIPGVSAAAIIDEPPLGTGGGNSPVYPPGTADFRPSNSPFAAKFFSISPGYLRAARTRLLAGRDFTWHDDNHAPRVALVNETFARKLFGSTPPIGLHFMTDSQSSLEIVGLLEDGKYDSLTEEPLAAMFFPLAQRPDSDTSLLVRSNLPQAQTAAALQNMLHKIDPTLPFNIESWPQLLALVLFPSRVATVALGVMGLLAVMLAVTGVFGMAAYSVSKRRKEFGIRIALGTRSMQLIRTALARPLVLLVVGSAAGLSFGLLASRLLGQIVYQATPHDPVVWTVAILGMAFLGISATWIPARRALGVDPAQLLKEDT
jgi:predicted permease